MHFYSLFNTGISDWRPRISVILAIKPIVAHQRNLKSRYATMVYSDPTTSTSQCTINQIIHYVGVGLHSGHNVSMNLYPAAPNTGICFVRKDVEPEHAVIQASWHNVVDTRLCTVLGNDHGVTISTVEHLLAAIRSCGVDNMLIELSGDEVPILDGSCAPLVDMTSGSNVRSKCGRASVMRCCRRAVYRGLPWTSISRMPPSARNVYRSK